MGNFQKRWVMKNELHYGNVGRIGNAVERQELSWSNDHLIDRFDSTTIHDTTLVYKRVFSAKLYFRRIVLKVWILAKNVPKIARQVSQPL